MKHYLGIDVGSVSTNIVCINEEYKVVESIYLRTYGNPLRSVQTGIQQLKTNIQNNIEISGVGVTGSARYLIGAMVNADLIKNEITAQAIASIQFYPGVETIIEIGGQDSKIIIIKNEVVADFAMNNVCAAGTGSFLDQQASRLGISIEEFSQKSVESKSEVVIAGRCTVFAESDMVHKQQLGYSLNDIINGLCFALVRNYLSSVAKGKTLNDLVLFQGGVAANVGIRRAFEKALGKKIIIPQYFNVMGAIGSAILAKEHMEVNGNGNSKTKFKGFDIADISFRTTSFICKDCPNSCEVVEFWEGDKIITYFGDKCGKYVG